MRLLAVLVLLRTASPTPKPADCAHGALVFGVGLPKSGTRSLGAAARRGLGFVPLKAFGGGVPYDFQRHFLPFAEGLPQNRSNPLAGLDVRESTIFTDFPWYALSCPLARAYPRALFVDVRRDCASWARSALSQLFCAWLQGGCTRAATYCATRAGNFPKNHLSRAVGFCTTKWYFDQIEPGLVGEDFCPRRREICGVGASGRKTYNGSDPATPGLLERLERVCRAHPKRVEACVPPERLLSIRLAADAGEVAKLAPFVGCPNSSAAIADVWAANGPQGHQLGFEHRGEVVQVTPGTSRPEGPRTRSRATPRA